MPIRKVLSRKLDVESRKMNREDLHTINNSSLTEYDWIESNVFTLLQYANASKLTLENLTIDEIASQIAFALSLPSTDAQITDIPDMVFKLSNGYPFWVEQICVFIEENGIEEFQKLASSLPNGPINKSREAGAGIAFRRKSVQEQSSLIAMQQGGSDSKIGKIDASTLSANKGGDNPLAFLIVSRFAKLTSDEQTLARYASIAGTDFCANVLRATLPPALSDHIPDLLDSLLRSGWITGCMSVGMCKMMYSFVHPLVFNTLYELTPLSVKRPVHRIVGEVSAVADD